MRIFLARNRIVLGQFANVRPAINAFSPNSKKHDANILIVLNIVKRRRNSSMVAMLSALSTFGRLTVT